VKVLRVLQDGSFQRVGGNDTRRSNFRLISASNRNFQAMIVEGTFRRIRLRPFAAVRARRRRHISAEAQGLTDRMFIRR